MAAWKLISRKGSEVARESYDELDQALAEMRRLAYAVIAEGPRSRVSALRDFEPADQVVARLEISGKGMLRAPTAGVDVMGDGSLVPFSGSVRREVLTPPRPGDEFDAVRQALS
jgi:hypothetical protein